MDCSICLELINEEDLIKFCCNQHYHFCCIKKWTDEHYTCPICRKVLSRKVLTILKKIQQNINQLKLQEEKTQHIIQTLMIEHENIKQRTKNNLKVISNMSCYTPQIPPTPILVHNQPFTYSRLLHRRGAIVLPLLLQTDDCAYPAFCRCLRCSQLSI